MKALIIGAAGFVGSYLAEAIKQYMYCDVAATKLPNEILDITDAEIINLNILDPLEIEAVFTDVHPDFIFHLAAQSSVSLSWRNPVLTVDVNIKGALNLLNEIRKLNYSPKVLVIGSGEEYGYIKEGCVPISEEAELNPGNVYAVTKACQNMMATIYAQAYGMNLIMVRAFNHIGPRQSPQFVVSDFCKQVVNIELERQKPVIMVGNLTVKRDFTDVRDVVRAYTSLIQYGRPGETYNVGSGHAISVGSILHKILSHTKAEIKVQIDPEKIRPVDIPIIEANTKKIYDHTGWKPEISLEETVVDTLDYWRKEIGGAR